MVLTVHDELVFEVPQAELAAASAAIRAGMESAYPLREPLVVDLRSAPNWRDAY